MARAAAFRAPHAGWFTRLPAAVPAVGMLLSLVFAPFVMPALRCAVLALDGGITLEPFSPSPAFALEVRCGGRVN